MPTDTPTNKSTAVEAGKLVDLIGGPSESEHRVVEVMLQVHRAEVAVTALNAIFLAVVPGELNPEIPIAGTAIKVDAETGFRRFRVPGCQSCAEGRLPRPAILSHSWQAGQKTEGGCAKDEFSYAVHAVRSIFTCAMRCRLEVAVIWLNLGELEASRV